MQLKTPPQNFLSTLLALREYYKPIVEKEVKTSVLNELSRGHRTGIISRVPGEKGVYT